MSNGRELSDLCGKNDGIESMIMCSSSCEMKILKANSKASDFFMLQICSIIKNEKLMNFDGRAIKQCLSECVCKCLLRKKKDIFMAL